MENTSPLILLRWHSNNDNYDFSHSRLLVGWFLLGNLHFLIWLKFPAFALKFFLGKVAVGCLLITGLATVGLLRWNKEMLCAYICTSVHALFLYCFILVSWMLLNLSFLFIFVFGFIEVEDREQCVSAVGARLIALPPRLQLAGGEQAWGHQVSMPTLPSPP